ncbi:MAG: NAD-dependent epimerase/dehydratase family protein [Bacteroidetes bacterium]|nr:NAD-dependent epimerase/dehydratase family protein [Bacteroidota bacterium]
MVQTILGSGGGIGLPLARELKNHTDNIRLVSRNPKKVNEGDELFPVDVNDLSRIDKAIEGSEVVYVTIGFEYNTKVWQHVWPPFLQEVIKACKKHGAKLVFFDNVYMYAKSAIPMMTESSPILPPSEKGKVRTKLQEMIMDEVEKKNIRALIARSADFYGPDNKNSALNMMVLDNLRKGKKAQAFGDIDKIHTYTYTPDAAKATALLGNTADAFNQVWHVPTTKEKLSTRQWIELIAKEIKMEPKIQTVPTWMVRVLGLFIPIMREFPEMMYQYEQDYIFDSTKFEKRFGILATSPLDGVREMI